MPRLLLASLALGLLYTPALAQRTIVVNVLTSDANDLDPTDGVCDGSPGTPGLQCSLYDAIGFANSPSESPAPVRIHFALASSPAQFEVRGRVFERPVILDCSTQPDSAPGRPQVLFNNNGFESSIFLFRGGHSTVRGCGFVHAPTSMLTFITVGHNVIEGNTFGLTASGGVPIGDGRVTGVNVADGANANRIGGPTAAQGNVFGSFGSEISGLTGTPIRLQSDSNTVAGNRVGLDASGTERRTVNGPCAVVTGSYNTVGGAGALGNAFGACSGVTVSGSRPSYTTTGNTVAGNTIGFLADGRTLVPGFVPGTTVAGVTVTAFDGGTVRGTVVGMPGAGNTVGGFPVGIRVSGDVAFTTRIEGNRVGTETSGTEARPNGVGIQIDGGVGTEIVGNVVSGNTSAGVVVTRGSFQNAPAGTLVQGNRIGTSADGRSALGNGAGVRVLGGAGGTRIGSAGAGNVVSGNRFEGIGVSGAATRGVRVEGNTVGLNVDGAALPNAGDGIAVTQAPDTIVGADDGGGNTVSANGRVGIYVTGANSAGTRVVNNTVGLGLDGTTARGNGQFGIQIVEAPDVVIGGAGTGNVVAANTSGIYVQSSPRARVAGNVVGSDRGGSRRRPNAGAGITIAASADARVGFDGTGGGSPNAVRYHRAPGIVVTNGSLGAALRGNTFDRNGLLTGGLGIDLGDDGPTANDAGDPDGGSNRLQNAPVLAAASFDERTGRLTLRYRVDTDAPNAAFPLRIEAYAADSTGRQGEIFLAADVYDTPAADRVATLETNLSSELLRNGPIVATATDAAGNTSEFSAPVVSMTVAAEDEGAAEPLALLPPAPNPARGAVTVRYTLPGPDRVTLSLVDALGRTVAVAAGTGLEGGGPHTRTLTLDGVAPGAYVLHLNVGTAVRTASIVVLR